MMKLADFKRIRYVCNCIIVDKASGEPAVEIWTSLGVFPIITANKTHLKGGKIKKSWLIGNKWYTSRKAAAAAYIQILEYTQTDK